MPNGLGTSPGRPRLVLPPYGRQRDGGAGGDLAQGEEPRGLRRGEVSDDRLAPDGPAPSQRVAECPPAYLRMQRRGFDLADMLHRWPALDKGLQAVERPGVAGDGEAVPFGRNTTVTTGPGMPCGRLARDGGGHGSLITLPGQLAPGARTAPPASPSGAGQLGLLYRARSSCRCKAVATG
jgi:hypothetical protein